MAYLHQTRDGVSDLVTIRQYVQLACHQENRESLRGDIDQEFLLTFSFFSFDSTFLSFRHSELLRLFVQLAFSDVGLFVSNLPITW